MEASPLKAMDFTAMDFKETPNEILIASKNKYPKKIFDAKEFISEVGAIDSLSQKPMVGLDLLNDASLNSMDVRNILCYLNKRDIKLSFLNLSNTNVDEHIFPRCYSLISNPDFKYLNIANTTIVEMQEGLAKEEKIIFIGKNHLKILKRKDLKKVFVKEAIERHERYYETTK